MLSVKRSESLRAGIEPLHSRESRWVGARVVAQALEFIGWIVLARRLDTSDLGVLTVGALIARYGGLVGDWGATFRGPRDVARYGEGSGEVAALVRRREQVTFVLCIAFAVAVVAVGHAPLVPLTAVLAARGVNRDFMSLGSRRFRRSLASITVQSTTLVVGAALVTSVGGASIVLAFSALASLVVSIVLHPVRREVRANAPATDAWFARFSIADQIVASSDSLFLAALRSTREAGIYGAVYRFPNAWTMLLGLAISAATPGVTRAFDDDPGSLPGLRRRALRIASIGTAISIVPAVIVTIAGPTLLGPAYSEGRSALALLFLSAVVLTAAAPLRPVYAAVGSDRSLALATMVVAAANLSANLVVIPRFGMIGAATTTVIAQTSLFVFELVATRRFAARGTAAPATA